MAWNRRHARCDQSPAPRTLVEAVHGAHRTGDHLRRQTDEPEGFVEGLAVGEVPCDIISEGGTLLWVVICLITKGQSLRQQRRRLYGFGVMALWPPCYPVPALGHRAAFVPWVDAHSSASRRREPMSGLIISPIIVFIRHLVSRPPP